MRHIRVIFLVFSFLFVITGCTQNISIHQTQNEIAQIDLVYSPFGENKILYTLTSDEIPTFMDSLMGLKLHKNSSPQNIGGGLYVQIVYFDNSVELIGTASVGYFPQNGSAEHDGWFYLLYDDLHTLFSKYVDIPTHYT